MLSGQLRAWKTRALVIKMEEMLSQGFSTGNNQRMNKIHSSVFSPTGKAGIKFLTDSIS